MKTGKLILICWVPRHVGIRGNEQADDVGVAVASAGPYAEPHDSIFYGPDALPDAQPTVLNQYCYLFHDFTATTTSRH